jgi:hypothetical protein
MRTTFCLLLPSCTMSHFVLPLGPITSCECWSLYCKRCDRRGSHLLRLVAEHRMIHKRAVSSGRIPPQNAFPIWHLRFLWLWMLRLWSHWHDRTVYLENVDTQQIRWPHSSENNHTLSAKLYGTTSHQTTFLIFFPVRSGSFMVTIYNRSLIPVIKPFVVIFDARSLTAVEKQKWKLLETDAM